MADGEFAYGRGGGRWRKKAADAAGKQAAGTRGTKSLVKRSASGRAEQAVPSVRGPDDAAGDGELAELHGAADVRHPVRRKAGVAPLKVPGLGGGKTLSDILPKDLKEIGREHVAAALLHSAKLCEKVGQLAQMAANLRSFAQVMGHFEAPVETSAAAVDPEERKRRIIEAGKSYGLVFPPGHPDADP